MLTDIWSKKDKVILNILIIAWLISISSFFVWWNQPKHVGTVFGFLTTSFALAWTTLLPAYCFVFILKMKKPQVLNRPKKRLRVAMIVTKAPSEPEEILHKTLLSMLSQDFPHDTWVADEDPTPKALDWYKKHNVFVSSRKGVEGYHNDTWPRRKKCKEGNLAYFYDTYGYKKYDVVVQMDIDHVPGKDYLKNMVEPFYNKEVGYVAAPSICDANFETSWSSRARGTSEAMFHGPIQAGSNSEWVPLCIGSHYAVRTTALKEIGGIGPELAEDYSTTLIMNANGWRGVWAPEAEAHGLGPNTFKDVITQDYQWSKSLFNLTLTLYPRVWKKLSLRQKIQFSFTQMWYPTSAFVWLVALILPILALITGQPPVKVPFEEFVVQISRPILFTYLIFVYVRRSKHLKPNNVKLFSWENMLFELARWPWVLIAVASSFFTLFKMKKGFSIKVTPKSKSPNEGVGEKVLMPYLLIALLCIVTLSFSTYSENTAGYFWFTLINGAVYTALVLLVTLAHIAESEGKTYKQTIKHIPHVVLSISVLAILIGTSQTNLPNQSSTHALNESEKQREETQITEMPTHSIESIDTIIIYKVTEGDNLWKIAERYYGNGAEWKRIVRPNSSTIIYPGDVLEIVSVELGND